MKKVFISLIAALACFAGASAQNVVNNPDNRDYFGIRAGLDIACPGDVSSQGIGVSVFGNGAGFHVGAIYNLNVVANFYVEPGLNFFYDTYSVKKEALESNVSSSSIRKFGLRIPIMAGYHFDFTPDIKLHVFTGPELETGFIAKQHAKVNGISMSENLYNGTDGLKRFDFIWDFGVALSYQQFQIGLTGGIGMVNMMEDTGFSDVTFHENRVSISLGYNF